MSDLEVAKRTSQAGVIAQCASACENAIVGILSLVLPDDKLDGELQEIRAQLLTHTHRLRQMAIDLEHR